MASSRARSKKTDPLEQQLLDIVRVAVARAASLSQDAAAKSAEPLKRQPQAPPRALAATVALALSGGRDSMALLDLLARLAVDARHRHTARDCHPRSSRSEPQCRRVARTLRSRMRTDGRAADHPPCRSQAAWPRHRGRSTRSALRRACGRRARSRRAHRDDGASPRRSSRNVSVAMDARCGARWSGSISRCSRF